VPELDAGVFQEDQQTTVKSVTLEGPATCLVQGCMRFLTSFCAAALLLSTTAFAQQQAPPPAHVSYVEGSATVEHDGETEPAVLNMPIVDGDRLRTSNGRVEVMFADGSAIEIDPMSEVEFVTSTRVRVLAGAIEHRAAEVNPRSTSGQYLPPDLQPYGPDLDQAGQWQYEASYGNVWYPTVAADWRPYYYGYWDPIPTYGPTWIGYDRWSWPTHHYGRWGYARNRWFWIPGRTWSAAWVSWGTAADYVSWCPLGYDGRPVGSLSLGYRSGWNAWTIVPRTQFGLRGYSVNRYAIDTHRVAATTPFVFHNTAPSFNRGRVSAIGSTRSAGVAVPRYESRAPVYGARTPSYRAATPSAEQPSRSVPRITTDPRRVPDSATRGSAYEMRRPAYERPSPTYQQRTPTYEQRSPNIERGSGYAIPRGSEVERPTYRPNYQPRYQPSAEPPRGEVRRVEPRQAPTMRESVPSRQAAPRMMPESAPSRQAAPSRGPSGPQGGPAGGSHRGAAGPRGEGGQGQGRSEGTARRR
jgi:hypothetical protein